MFYLDSIKLGCLFWPLWGAFVSGFCSPYLGSRLASYFSVSCLFVSFFLSIYALYFIGFSQQIVILMVIITSVSIIVHIYATSYTHSDPHKSRFFSCISLFTFFMLMLVTAENYFQLFWMG
jgi:NADH-quinone oxidoreductase subunit L